MKRQLEILVEEPSMEVFLKGLLPSLLPEVFNLILIVLFIHMRVKMTYRSTCPKECVPIKGIRVECC